MKTPVAQRIVRLFFAFAIGLLTVGWAGCSGNYSSRSDINMNGHRTVKQTSNGVKRTLETRQAVTFQNGKITQFPPGAVVSISESQAGRTVVAELREHDGKPELWMKNGDTFSKGSPEDEAWLGSFLEALKIDDRSKSEVALTDVRERVEAGNPDFLAKVPDISFSSERAELLKTVIKERDLTPGQQVEVVRTAFDHLSFASEQESVLLTLIQKPEFSTEAKKAITDRIDRLTFDSNKVTVQKALLAK